MGSKRVFVLGLDGATFDLIRPWASEGKLPAFSRLMNEGVWGELDSVPNQRSAAAWTSFMTGKNPGKHGIFEFYEYVASSCSVRFINSKHRDAKSLWKILSEKEKKVGVINVPMTFPAEELNGFLIAGLDSPSVKSKGFTYPPDLYDKLYKEFGDYILEPGLTGAIVGGRVKQAIDMVKEELGQKMDITRHLKKNYAWDFFMVVLRSLDAVQHCFWKYMDTSHPEFNLNESKLYGDTIFNTYKDIDRFLGELLNSLDGDTILMVMSDHGFGKKHPASSQLNQWLESKGYLAYRKSASGDRSVLGSVYKKIIGWTPRKVKEWLWDTFPLLRDKVQTRLCFANIDWSRTVAYSDSLFPNIRINLRGREGHGIVREGAEYESLIEKLISEIKELRDLKTGERITEDVFRQKDIYHGVHVHKAPALLLRWREDITISGIRLDGNSRVEPVTPPVPGEDYHVISGDHHQRGVFLVKGRDIRRGQNITGTHIVDLAPTVLYQMGVQVPDGMDGKILSSIFEEVFLKSNPVSFDRDEAKENVRPDYKKYTADEKKEIEDRLKGLGYL